MSMTWRGSGLHPQRSPVRCAKFIYPFGISINPVDREWSQLSKFDDTRQRFSCHRLP